MAQLRQGLFAAMEPVVQAAGYELVEVEMVGAGREAVLRIYIDRLPGSGAPEIPDSDGAEGEVAAQGGISVEDCEKVSRTLSEWLDVEDPRVAGDRIRRLVVAQDTGGAIRGPVRGDLFWGHGAAAEDAAGRMRSQGRYWLLLPAGVSPPGA